MKLLNPFRRRPRHAPVVMLLAEPRECVQGLKHLGNLRLAERCQALQMRPSRREQDALRELAAHRCQIPGVTQRSLGHLVLRPLAK